MRIRILSVVFVERKAVDFKDKNAGCEGGIIRKKLPSLARLSGNSAAFLSATAACILHVQAAADAPLINRTAQIAQLHSAENSVNSSEKPAGFYEELAQKTETKFVKTSSIFLETDDIFCACFAITHLQKQGTAASEPSNNLRFLIKKAANTPPETLEKFENEHLTIVPVETYQADEIKRIRNSTGLTQRSFAEYMGVSPKTVEAWEAGRNHPEGAACRLLSLTKADPEFPQKAGIILR